VADRCVRWAAGPSLGLGGGGWRQDDERRPVIEDRGGMPGPRIWRGQTNENDAPAGGGKPSLTFKKSVKAELHVSVSHDDEHAVVNELAEG
jgi:hypothetical protein